MPKQINREDLKQALDYVFNQRPKERKIMGYRGCKTYGYINLDSINHCKDPECSSCRMYDKALQDVMEEELAKMKDSPEYIEQLIKDNESKQ